MAHALGYAVQDAATGGGSDAHNTVTLGIATIMDGSGPIGGPNHSPREYITISSVVPRMVMLTGLIVRICRG